MHNTFRTLFPAPDEKFLSLPLADIIALGISRIVLPPCFWALVDRSDTLIKYYVSVSLLPMHVCSFVERRERAKTDLHNVAGAVSLAVTTARTRGQDVADVVAVVAIVVGVAAAVVAAAVGIHAFAQIERASAPFPKTLTRV